MLCGKSGCGKSTLLRQMKKNLTPFGDFQGQILYRGADIATLEDRISAQEIGFVQQNPENQIVTDKVWHELAFGLESLGYDNSTIRRRVSEMASFFGIQAWFRKSVADLSGGQKQLLNLASIMAMQPKLLILDEPTSQLDPIASLEFLETLSRINRELGTTIVLSEHRLEEVLPLADKVVVMEEGRILADDDVETVAAYRGEQKNVMSQGLPAVMKVYAEIKPQGKCPITVREGRLWLDTLFPQGVTVSSMAALRPEPPLLLEGETELELDDVWFRYSRSADDIVRGLNLKINRGELFCLVGGNGVGKSTTLRLISGILKPYRGRVTIHGSTGKGGQRGIIGVLPQNPQAVFTEITVEEELYDSLFYDKRKEADKLQAVTDMLELLMLSHLRKAHPYDLSGGEQQRLALGKILLLQPNILLLDEPTKGLDPYFKSVLAELLHKLRRQGVTILMVTHDIEFAAEHADRCAMMFDGDIVSLDRPRAFFSGNSFYTTASNRMARHLFPDAITCQDVMELCRANLI